MKDTHFVNANGLDAAGHLTSAYDVMLMSKELLKHKEIFDYTTVWMDSLQRRKDPACKYKQAYTHIRRNQRT